MSIYLLWANFCPFICCGPIFVHLFVVGQNWSYNICSYGQSFVYYISIQFDSVCKSEWVGCEHLTSLWEEGSWDGEGGSDLLLQSFFHTETLCPLFIPCMAAISICLIIAGGLLWKCLLLWPVHFSPWATNCLCISPQCTE